MMSEDGRHGEEGNHVLRHISVQRFEAEITPDEITDDPRCLNVGLDFTNEEMCKYECSCGEWFQKAETAHQHLMEVLDL